jgi:hypothetical protein
MATATSAYRNSDETQSLKRGEFLSRDDIAKLLDAADFSRDSEATIIRRSGREKGTRNYRRRHLVTALKGIWRASKEPYSSTGEILCFAAVEGYAIEAGVSERALRYNLRELEKIGVLQMVFAANTIRRPATYRLNLSALRRRRTYDEVKKSRPPRRALHSIHHSSPPAQEPAKAAAPPVNTAAPVAVAPVRDAHRSSSPPAISRGEDRVRKLRLDLMTKWTELKRGYCGSVNTSQGLLYIDEDHPRYRAPMSSENAWIAALTFFQISEKEARDKLKLTYGKLEDSEPSP